MKEIKPMSPTGGTASHRGGYLALWSMVIASVMWSWGTVVLTNAFEGAPHLEPDTVPFLLLPNFLAHMLRIAALVLFTIAAIRATLNFPSMPIIFFALGCAAYSRSPFVAVYLAWLSITAALIGYWFYRKVHGGNPRS